MTPKVSATEAPRGVNASWSTFLTAAAGAISAVALTPCQGRAAVVSVTTRPISQTPTNALGSTAYWDVDGDSTNDFRLFVDNDQFGSPAVFFGSGGSNGRGLVGPSFNTDNVQALSKGFQIGPTLGSGLFWGAGSIAGYNYRAMMASDGQIGYDWNFGFNQGDNYFGFRFEKAGLLHYGYGVANFDSANKIVTISSWAYNSEPNQSIGVGQMPALVPGPIGLAGLAAGAAWSRRLRRRVRETS